MLDLLIVLFFKLCINVELVSKIKCVCPQCVFNHDGNLFAAITGKVIHIYNVRTQKKVELTGHDKKVSHHRIQSSETNLHAIFLYNVDQISLVHIDTLFEPFRCCR